MKVSIIGSNGLLSSTMCEFCNKNNIPFDVYGLEEPFNTNYNNFYEIDLVNNEIDFDLLSDSDIIIYAAGAGIQSNQRDEIDLVYNLNVLVPIKICYSLEYHKYKGAFVTFGSYFEIGENNLDIKFNEVDVCNSQRNVPNSYCISKRLLSRFINSYKPSFKLWHFILPTIYGAKENPLRLIPYTINAIVGDQKVQYTSGNQVRQYIYIGEIPIIILKGFQKQIESGVYCIEGTETISVKDLVLELFSYFNKSPKDYVDFGSANRDDTGMKILRLDGKKIKSKINYNPSIKIADVYKEYLKQKV